MEHKVTITSNEVSQVGGFFNQSAGSKFVLRWGWFVLLSMLLTTVCSYFIPDTASYEQYQATLQVQVRVTSSTSLQGIATTTFFASLLQSPGVSDLALTRLHTYPQFKAYEPVDLQDGLVTATVIKGTNVIQLSGYGDTSRDATLIVKAVYDALIQKIQKDRVSVLDGINARLNAELAQVQADMARTETTLEELKAIKQTSSSQFTLLANQYSAQKQRLQEITAGLASLKQEGYDDLLTVVNSTPAITTIPAASSTKGDRLTLSPFVGLIMGLGAVLLASRFSTNMSLKEKKRETLPPLSETREEIGGRW
jgi:hypothetical protein